MAFKKAERKHARLHLAFAGPAGSGKTLTSLILAHYIAKRLGKGRVAIIDTERGRSKLYAGYELPDGDKLDFDVEDGLKTFSPQTFVQTIHEAEKAGYDVIVIDSTSHEWRGSGGVLEKVDNASASGNKWAGWRVGTPAHNEFIDAILQSKCHVIGTMRSKTEWVLEEVVNKQGAKVQQPKAIGLGVVQRDDTDYEFDFVGLFDDQHALRITKTCFKAIDGKTFHEPGAEFAQVFIDWLLAGGVNDVEPEAKELARPTPPPASTTTPAATTTTTTAASAASPATAPAAKESSPTADRPAKGFAEAMRNAATVAALDGAAGGIGAAVKSGAVTSEERGELVKLYTELKTKLPAAAASEKAA